MEVLMIIFIIVLIIAGAGLIGYGLVDTKILPIIMGFICFVAWIIILCAYCNRPQKYEVARTETFYGSTDKINRVWLMKNGEYFWIQIPDCEKSKFKQGEYIELRNSEMKGYISSKDLDN